MAQYNEFDKLFRNILANLGMVRRTDEEKEKDNKKPSNCISISPSQLLVISGLLSGILSVRSVLVDREQNIEIFLDGSLKQKTELDKTLDTIGELSFDEVLRAMLKRI